MASLKICHCIQKPVVSIRFYISAYLTHLTACIVLLYWSPEPGQYYVACILAGMFGASMAAYEPLLAGTSRHIYVYFKSVLTEDL